MGKKDLTGKEFFADSSRFAELLNVILYQRKNIIQAEKLEPISRSYPSLFGKGENNRDLFMKDTQTQICYGLELETESDYSMPERVMVYDVCEWERQIRELSKRYENEARDEKKLAYREKKSRIKETDYLLPVVTVVLYLGTGHWQGKIRLSELYCLPEGIQSFGFFPDYDFPMAEADFVDIEVFNTDLREFFEAMQCRGDKVKLRELLKMERFCKLKEDTAWAIAVFLDRKRLTAKIEKGDEGMCIALDELLEDERMAGRNEGKREGREEGKSEERTFIINNMVHEGIERELICKVTGCSREEMETILERTEVTI